MSEPPRMPNSPLKWMGGKRSLRSEIIPLLPADCLCYVEVFGGAGWVLFGKDLSNLEVYNDLNGDLVNLWRVLKWRPAELLERVTANEVLRSRELFYAARSTKLDELDEMTRAEAFYLLIMQSFGASVGHLSSVSFGTGKLGRGSLWSHRQKPFDTFLPAAERLRYVTIERLHFAECIKKYDAKSTVFFCDPPYYEQAGYAVPFGKTDHMRLANVLKHCAGRWLVTINAHPFIKKLYDGYHFTDLLERRSVALNLDVRQDAPIWAISNYDPATVTPMPMADIEKVREKQRQLDAQGADDDDDDEGEDA